MNLFELAAKITLDSKDFDSGVNSAVSKAKGLATSIGKGFATTAKVITAGIGAAATGIAALTGMAVKNYAEYEQLVGGVDTLFKESSQKVQEYAANAYKTAGLSANQYMETVTGFSASLLQSLGGDTKKAAEYADMAITDMSDNANKMGTSMESIQYAYQGFAKQNFTMLDNLKLGYGGTKQEMERLIADAHKLDGSIKENDLSFQNVVKAIHAVQTELDITGTTMKEAEHTISGSVNSMKAAWSNLVTGIANDNANFDNLVKQFVESIEIAAQNILPRVETALNGVVKLIDGLFPVIAEKIPALIESILPKLVEAGVKIVESLINGIKQNQESLIATAINVVNILVNAFVELLPQVIELGIQLILTLAEGLAQGLPELIPKIVEVILKIYETIVNNLDKILEAGLKILLALTEGIIKSIPKLVSELPKIITAIVDFLISSLPKIFAVGIEIITELGKGMLSMLSSLISIVSEMFSKMVAKMQEFMSKFLEKGTQIVENIKNGFSNAWNNFVQKVSELWNELVNWFGRKIEEFKDWGHKIVDNLQSGLSNSWHNLTSWFSDAWDNLGETVTNFIDRCLDWGRNIVNNIREGIASAWDGLTSWFSNLWDGLFGNKKIDVDIDTGGNNDFEKPDNPRMLNGYHKNGLDYVPFDDYRALLHKGERVLTAEENKRYNNNQGTKTVVNQYIQTVPQTPAEFAMATLTSFEEARWAF